MSTLYFVEGQNKNIDSAEQKHIIWDMESLGMGGEAGAGQKIN